MELAALLVLVPALVLGVLRLYYRPPSLRNRTTSEAVRLSDATTIGRAVLAHRGARSSVSGVVALHDGLDAFGARISLMREAEVALDVQYYIWHRDLTGLVLLDELHQAAERGVRVRLLLDDNGIDGLDADLAALNAHPNVEVRLSTLR